MPTPPEIEGHGLVGPADAAAARETDPEAVSRSSGVGSPPDVRGKATVFSDLLSVSMARAVSIVFSIISVSLVTHLLSPAKYAVLAYVTVIASLLLTCSSSWTATAVTRYGREELELTGLVRGTNWARLALIAPVIAGATALIVFLRVVGALPRPLSWGFVGVACALGLTNISSQHFISLLEACGRMKLTAVGLTLGQALSVAGIVVLFAARLRSPMAVALAQLFPGILVAAFLVNRLWRVGIWPPVIDRALLRRVLSLSLPLIAFAVSQYVIGAIDVVILGAYRSARDVGLYAIAYQGYGTLQAIATTATIVLSPLLVSLRVAHQEHLIARYYDRVVPQVVVLCSIGAGLAAPLISLAVPLVFGAAFTRASEPLSLLLIAWILYTAASFAAPILVLHERGRALGIINAIAALVNVLGDWVLIRIVGLGIAAPALATTAALLVIAIGYLHVGAQCVGARPLWPIVLITPAVAGVAVSLALAGLLGAALSVAVTLAVAAVVLVGRRPFSSQDAEMIGQLDLPAPAKRLILGVLAHLH
jgi:O-antigen/teichoic acid export membrane protein